jgi:hypothetical protein
MNVGPSRRITFHVEMLRSPVDPLKHEMSSILESNRLIESDISYKQLKCQIATDNPVAFMEIHWHRFSEPDVAGGIFRQLAESFHLRRHANYGTRSFWLFLFRKHPFWSIFSLLHAPSAILVPLTFALTSAKSNGRRPYHTISLYDQSSLLRILSMAPSIRWPLATNFLTE